MEATIAEIEVEILEVQARHYHVHLDGRLMNKESFERGKEMNTTQVLSSDIEDNVIPSTQSKNTKSSSMIQNASMAIGELSNTRYLYPPNTSKHVQGGRNLGWNPSFIIASQT